jgi:hypothetical protein
MDQSPWLARRSRKDSQLASNRNFRIRDGKIAEEWVSRDELGMLIERGF